MTTRDHLTGIQFPKDTEILNLSKTLSTLLSREVSEKVGADISIPQYKAIELALKESLSSRDTDSQ